MGKMVKTLGDAEFEIMQIIWAFNSPISSTRIHAKLLERRNWHLSTLFNQDISNLNENLALGNLSDTAQETYTHLQELE